ncbi:MAG: hypothetical protein A4S09_09450 [Proteobacteria bacterium SG_bin7]|nr:MAG: hypothetical protein A4S09_09450 [Proteobacteria bacterium SG_bin7]
MAVLVRLAVVLAVFSSSVGFSDENYWSEFSSPWKTDAKYIFFGGLGLAIFLKQATPDFVESTQRTWTRDRPLGDDSKYGDYFGQGIPNIFYVIGMGSHYYLTRSEKSAQRSLYMLKTSLYSTVLTHAMKLAWQDPRPDNPSQKDSFPSGHTTAAFAFASSVGMEHGVYWGTLSYLAATYAGFSRINDNKHRLSDVVAGAAIGVSYGIGLYQYVHGEDKSKTAFAVLPSDDLDGVVVNYWRSH